MMWTAFLVACGVLVVFVGLPRLFGSFIAFGDADLDPVSPEGLRAIVREECRQGVVDQPCMVWPIDKLHDRLEDCRG